MKTMSKPSIVQIEEDHLKHLTREVAETVAVDLLQKSRRAKKKFGPADLWKCRKLCRTANIIIR